MRYRIHEAELFVPDGFSDRTINTFFLPAGTTGGALSFVVTRDYESPQADLTTYADQQLILASQKLPSYKYISRRAILIDGQPAVQADYTWRSPEGVAVYQRQAVVKAGKAFLVFTYTSIQQETQRIELLWNQTIQSVRLTQEAPVRG